MKRKLITALFLMTILYARAQDRYYKQGQLYICMMDLGEKSQEFVKKNHLQQAVLFDGRYIDPNKISTLDKKTFAAAIQEKFPVNSATGVGVLDLEGVVLEGLNKSSDSFAFKKAINMFIQTIQFAKSLRPNVKWGFYSLPFTSYWHRDEKLSLLNEQIRPLLLQCDILFPSFYIYYKDGSVSVNDNELYASQNVRQILSIAQRLNKPVMPFIWHRYHDSNRTIGLQLIPIADFVKYVNKLITTSYYGKKISGLVWWGADAYYYRIKSQALVNEMNGVKNSDFNAHHDSIIMNYGNAILNCIVKYNK